MKVLVSLFLVLASLAVSAQSYPLNILVNKKEDKIIFEAENRGSTDLVATLLIKNAKGLRGNKRPKPITIAQGSSKVITELEIVGSYSYDYESSYVEIINTKKRDEINKTISLNDTYKLNASDDINKGIVVFNKNDCPRCNLTTAYLYENNIPFKIVDISKQGEGNRLMWQLLREKGIKKDITTPVILVDGKLTYSHDNLSLFLEKLK